MRTTIKIILLWTIISIIGHVAEGDTHVLGNIRVAIGNTLRDETISLEDDKNLVVKGNFVQSYDIPNDFFHVLKAVVDYVGDKDGYRAKYILEKEFHSPILHISPSTLKSLTIDPEEKPKNSEVLNNTEGFK